jgi:disulfide bond formation protein DsbB
MQKGLKQANLVGNMEPSTSLVLYLALLCAATASAGSLFFSEVMELPPCVLCWYQRIAMYPLVLILGVSIVRKDHGHIYYGLPLAIIGFAIAVYHNLLYYKIIPESIVPCTSGISCTSRQIEWLGFITIPFMSLCAFSLIFAFLLVQVKFRSPR